MQTLTRDLRRSLESTVRAARRIAEAGARKVIQQLAVDHHEPYPSMTPEQRELRNALRAHGRQLGDRRDEKRGVQAIDRLTTECAYEHWHRMLFARFLAESNLLIEPESGMDITLEDCQELARERGGDWLELASQFAERMLPEIFRTSDPVLKVALPPETRSELENVLKALPHDVFVADDSLGWVYQYWQADRKDEVNRSENKIGADELPAVTQLFTEDYMVLFLLHNTLGAWWAGKVLATNPGVASAAKTEDELRAICAVGGVEWSHLRFVRDGDGPWRPAAGTFEGWPKVAKEIKVLDPCMGSGHFLVFALPILIAFRMDEEGLSRKETADAVLRDNLFGLEIDPRCTQIAAFNLALAAWRRIGYRALPALHLACSGLSLGVSKTEWLKLAERLATALPTPPKADLLGTEDNLFSDAMKRGFERVHDLFARAPLLGSLINPRGSAGDLVEQGFADLEILLTTVLMHANSAEISEMAVAAQGVAKAAEILASQFTLVATNVPYLGRGKQDELLRDYCEHHHPDAKADLATCFVERSLDFCELGGCISLVTPQHWLFLKTYKRLREKLLTGFGWDALAQLGPNAFEAIGGDVVNVCLIAMSAGKFDESRNMYGLDATEFQSAAEKDSYLRSGPIVEIAQADQLKKPDARINLHQASDLPLLESFALGLQGISPADFPHYGRFFWEIRNLSEWQFWQSSIETTQSYSGRDLLLWWNKDLETAINQGVAYVRGQEAWGKRGVVVRQMGALSVAIYTGEKFDTNCAVIVPYIEDHLLAIWCFCSSGQFADSVRQIDKKLNVTNATLCKVPFDLDYWQGVANEKYPLGLPKPHSDDPTQWLFNGNPLGALQPLQVAVARLVNYRWPRQGGSSFWEAAAFASDGLERHADQSGIVILNTVKGEQSAANRLIALLADALGVEWSAAKLDNMLLQIGFGGKTLDDWLRDGFFSQHCELFQHRPLVWHVWDGRRDGFHALVNYHRLAASNGEGRRTLEKLLYTYLGDWIDLQRSDQSAGIEGADARLAAAEHLKSELSNILSGEPPYDLFVRWKPLTDQAIGWEPDVNDGVRMNIRPFMNAKPVGTKAKGACILRVTPKVKWEKDRGKEPQRAKEDFPWFWGWNPDDPIQTSNFTGGQTFDGNRWNDLHYSNAAKRAARGKGSTA